MRASKARCKVVIFHHPIWSSDHGLTTAAGSPASEPSFRCSSAGGADLVLNGHVHNYERSKPMWGKRVSRRRGITYVVSGGGGAELRRLRYVSAGPRWSAKRGAFPEIVRFKYRAGRLFGRTIAANGQLVDQFSVRCR